MTVTIHPFSVTAANDAAGLAEVLRATVVLDAKRVVLLAKIPGPATLNDPSRELAQLVFRAAVAHAGGEALMQRSRMILSVGCEGVGSAGGWLLADDGVEAPTTEGDARLSLGTAESAPIPEAERGMPAHVAAVARAVEAAMSESGLDHDTVRLVLVKSPVRRSQADATGRSRGAAALGVAVALEEVAIEHVTDAAMIDPSLFSTRAMTMSGTETGRAEVVVLGNRPGAGGNLVIGSRPLCDIIDVAGARGLLRELGGSFDEDGVLMEPASFPMTLFKAGLRQDGLLRGRPTQVHGTDMPADKHLRAAASGVLASLLGSTDAFVTGGAEHQAPPGGCLIAAIARVSP